jgi:uncharacterized lipoprotein NlpE involved in copper resistance
MFNKSIYSIIALSCILTGCNNKIDPNNPPITPNYDAQHELITVYQNRADIPQGAKIITHVTALNTLPNGSKATPGAVMVELKRQAQLAGGFGLINIIPGTAQTTADVVGIR